MAWFFRRQHSDAGRMLLAMIVSFFLLFSVVSIGAPRKFTSPDETANFFFLQRLARHAGLRVPTDLAPLAGVAPAPRSMTFIEQRLVPTGFYGLVILYGAFALLFGSWSVFLWTPLLAVLGASCAFLLIRPLLGSSKALLAVALFLLHPAVWLYGSKPFFPNLPFLSLTLISLLLLARGAQTANRWAAAFGGLALAAALFVRTSEVFWVLPLFLLLGVVARDVRRRTFFLPVVGACGAVLTVFLLLNTYLYGSPVEFGYSALPVATESLAELSASVGEKVRTAVLPLGLELRNIGPAAWRYLVLQFPLPALLTAFGLVVTLRRVHLRDARRERHLLLIAACVSVPLIVVYGSWPLYEYVDPTTSILASSYIRYWLPVYAVLTPFTALGFCWLRERFARRTRLFPAAVLAGIVLTSSLTVYADPRHGLVVLRQQAQAYERRAAAVAKETSPSTLILSGAADKVLFPERQVIVQLPAGDLRPTLLKVIAQRPFAYYAVGADPRAAATLHRLQEAGFSLTEEATFSDATLYGVHP